MRKLFAFITALFLLLPAASTNAAQTWQQIHDHIATEMDGVYAIYQSGDAEGAKDAVNNIYYGIYEKDGLESAVRSSISSKSANLTEYQFYTLKKAIRSGAPQSEVEAEGAKLLDMVQTISVAPVMRRSSRPSTTGRSQALSAASSVPISLPRCSTRRQRRARAAR